MKNKYQYPDFKAITPLKFQELPIGFTHYLLRLNFISSSFNWGKIGMPIHKVVLRLLTKSPIWQQKRNKRFYVLAAISILLTGYIGSYRRFSNPIHPTLKGQAVQITYPSFFTLRPLKKGPIGCPEMSVSNYQSTLCDISEQQKSHSHRDESLKSLAVLTP